MKLHHCSYIIMSFLQHILYIRQPDPNMAGIRHYHGTLAIINCIMIINFFSILLGELDLEKAMAAWSENEKIYYTFATGDCKDGEQCGHYTQIVWATSTEVGCAYYRCPYLTNTGYSNAAYLVCNYGPAGNYRGVQPYKVGPACTECSNGKGWCNDGLCDGRFLIF